MLQRIILPATLRDENLALENVQVSVKKRRSFAVTVHETPLTEFRLLSVQPDTNGLQTEFGGTKYCL